MIFYRFPTESDTLIIIVNEYKGREKKKEKVVISIREEYNRRDCNVMSVRSELGL